MEDPAATLALWDYRRRVEALYAEVRHLGSSETAWDYWRRARDDLFAHHPQSALDEKQRRSFQGLRYFPYDPTWRFVTDVEPIPIGTIELDHNSPAVTPFRRFGVVRLERAGQVVELTLFWLETYGGGAFLPFRDATSGAETYGGGRYLLDTVKGADLGRDGTRLILDFNFAYHPSCAHNPTWSCPLAPADNQLAVPINAGERL
jgi:uncharacterized protein (DUF1684 family)